MLSFDLQHTVPRQLHSRRQQIIGRTLASVSAIIASTPLVLSCSLLSSAAMALINEVLLALPLLSTRVEAGESEDIAEAGRCVWRERRLRGAAAGKQ